MIKNKLELKEENDLEFGHCPNIFVHQCTCIIAACHNHHYLCMCSENHKPYTPYALQTFHKLKLSVFSKCLQQILMA